MPAHRIHLKGPWEYEWLTPPPAGVEPSGRVRLPAEWRGLFGTHAGRVRFRRRFQCPTNLEPHEQVFVVFTGAGGTARVFLNNDPLGEFADPRDASFDITGRLHRTNELTVELEFTPADSPDAPGGLWSPVALEIRPAES